jgi:predicted dinucleotide-binding enzyme
MTGIIGAGHIGGTLTRQQDLDADGVRRALSQASRERTAQLHAPPGSKALTG